MNTTCTKDNITKRLTFEALNYLSSSNTVVCVSDLNEKFRAGMRRAWGYSSRELDLAKPPASLCHSTYFMMNPSVSMATPCILERLLLELTPIVLYMSSCMPFFPGLLSLF